MENIQKKDELCHSGVLGMKWGIRKKKEPTDRIYTHRTSNGTYHTFDSDYETNSRGERVLKGSAKSRIFYEANSGRMAREYLTESQSRLYDELTNQSGDFISAGMEYLKKFL